MKQLDTLLQLTDTFEKTCLQSLAKTPNGKSSVSKKKRLTKSEFMKHFDKAKSDDNGTPVKPIDLTKADEFSYSALMRKLRQEATPEQVMTFLKLFKIQFDKAVKGKVNKPERIALQNAIIKFNKINPIKLDKKMVKCAAVAELGNADSVGKYLSDIVKFILARLPLEKRPRAAQILKQKFAVLSENEIASKNMPNAAVYGQAITFVKHVLFNQDANYIREVLNSLSRNL